MFPISLARRTRPWCRSAPFSSGPLGAPRCSFSPQRQHRLHALHRSRQVTRRYLNSPTTDVKSPSSPSSIVLHHQEDEDPFSSSRGFWPSNRPSSHDNHEEGHESEDNKVASSIEEALDPTPPPPAASLLPRHRPHKLDLSHTNARDAQRTQREAPKARVGFLEASPPSFRSNKGLRKVVDQYCRQVDLQLRQPGLLKSKPTRPADLDHAIQETFSEDTLALLRIKGYEPTDVVSWAWIINSSTVSRAVQRYVALANDLRKQNKPDMPRFVPLQILRAESMTAASFNALLSEISRSVKHHPLHMITEDGSSIIDIEPDKADARAKAWDYSSAMLLIVRLVRHARKTEPATLEEIADLACMMLFSLRDHKSGGLDTLTFMCNRLLALIALPSNVGPFRSILKHQQAQLLLLRRMMAQTPRIPVTREGYRALIKVQLLHEKTEEEKEWAQAKSESWPPWPKAKLGIDENREYLGRESRAMKMLRRMTEAGYAHHAWEKAAAVLAGWDTDKSPTIQTRRIYNMPPMAALAGFLNSQGEMHMLAELWANRVTATRSIREAWACLTAYRTSVPKDGRRLEPYHAMFEKLLARPQDESQDNDVLPGDAKETFADPTSPRDLLFLEIGVPSAKDFYDLMMSDGVRPAGRLLSLLMETAHSLRQGIGFLKNSSYGEVKKDVLLHGEKYPEPVIRDTLFSIPDHFFAAFVKLLCRSASDTDSGGIEFRPLSYMSKKKDIVTPKHYAFMLLVASRTAYLPVYNSALEGVESQLLYLRTLRNPSSRDLRSAWQTVRATLLRMNELGIDPELSTFRNFARIVLHYLHPRLPWSPSPRYVLHLVKQTFVSSIYGAWERTWLDATADDPILVVPYPEDIRLLVEILGIGQDIDGLLELVDWMARSSDRLRTASSEIASGERVMKVLLLQIHFFLEGAWASRSDRDKGIRTANETQIIQAQEKLQPLGWPTVQEVEDFVEQRVEWLARVRRSAWKASKAKAMDRISGEDGGTQRDTVGALDQVQ